jgi:quercetin dioxygenase-like cupin family protein
MPDEGGSAACFAEQVCPECGRIIQAGHGCTVVARLDQIDDASGTDGVMWTAPPGRDLNVNVVRLRARGEMPDHVNDALDVLVVVHSGTGTLTTTDRIVPLAAGVVVVVPRGMRRSIQAGELGLRYLTAHVARPPLGLTPRPGAEPPTGGGPGGR